MQISTHYRIANLSEIHDGSVKVPKTA
jgi:hypothetical protein